MWLTKSALFTWRIIARVYVDLVLYTHIRERVGFHLDFLKPGYHCIFRVWDRWSCVLQQRGAVLCFISWLLGTVATKTRTRAEGSKGRLIASPVVSSTRGKEGRQDLPKVVALLSSDPFLMAWPWVWVCSESCESPHHFILSRSLLICFLSAPSSLPLFCMLPQPLKIKQQTKLVCSHHCFGSVNLIS